MSVLRINQNPIAVNANRNLRVTGMAIARSIERLSSGLRINRAADDAAGLSISEKLRAQIRGINRASANSLDGISLIQTAEGALNELHTILQRMRELAVQAANGIYTANDRQALQLEITQLTDEINRIAATTEFNTKRLLDGTLGALVSTDDYTRVRAAVVGSVGAGGNFVLRAAAKSTGALQVQKSDVFTTEANTDAIGKINYLATWRADATIATAGPDGVGNTGVYQVEVSYTGGEEIFASGTEGGLTLWDNSGGGGGYALAAAGDLAVNNFQNHEITDNVDRFIFTTSDDTNGVLVHSIVLDTSWTWTQLASVVGTTLFTDGGPDLIAAPTDVAFGTAPGRLDISLTAATNARILNVQFDDSDGSGSDFYLSFGQPAANLFRSNLFVGAVDYEFGNNGVVDSGTITAAAASTYAVGTAGIGNTGVIDIRLDNRYDWSNIDGGGSQNDTLVWNRYSGGNSLQDYGQVWQVGPVPANYTFLISAVSDREYAVFSFDNQTYTDMVAQGMDQDTAQASARGGQIGPNQLIDSTYAGPDGSALENVRIAFDGILQAGETATFNISSNNVLTADQLCTLASLNRFQDFGVFNGRKNVAIDVFLRGTAQHSTVNISTNDTFEDLAGKLSLAIWNTAGTGVITSAIVNPEQPPDLVHVNTIGDAKGTLSIVTPVPGAELVISGDEALLKALSLVDVREGQAPVYSLSAFNLETNKNVGSVETDSNEINGLLPGLRIYFDNTLGLRLDPQPPTNVNGGPNTMTSFAYPLAGERPEISLSGEVETFFMHVAPRDFALQIGANQGQVISSYISDHSAESLGVEGLLIMTSQLAQEAISMIDVAVDRVSTQRSRLGAMQNRLESTVRNLDIAAENLTAAESRIRDADIALETMASTRNQILLQAGVAALAQANQLPQAVLQLLR